MQISSLGVRIQNMPERINNFIGMVIKTSANIYEIRGIQTGNDFKDKEQTIHSFHLPEDREIIDQLNLESLRKKLCHFTIWYAETLKPKTTIEGIIIETNLEARRKSIASDTITYPKKKSTDIVGETKPSQVEEHFVSEL